VATRLAQCTLSNLASGKQSAYIQVNANATETLTMKNFVFVVINNGRQERDPADVDATTGRGECVTEPLYSYIENSSGSRQGR